MTTARVVGVVAGLILLVAAIVAWFASPWITAVLVGAAVLILSGWQFYRRSKGIEPLPASPWTSYIWPLTFGALAVIALNGWIMQVSRGADGEGSVGTEMVVGLVTGVVFMAAAYGYGRVRAQKVQVAEQQYGVDEPTSAEDDVDPNEWLKSFNRDEL